MTRNEESVETDIEFTVRLMTLVISAMCIVSIVLLRINMNGIKKPNKNGIKQIEKYGIDVIVWDYRHRYFWDGGAHCCTQDISRH